MHRVRLRTMVDTLVLSGDGRSAQSVLLCVGSPDLMYNVLYPIYDVHLFTRRMRINSRLCM